MAKLKNKQHEAFCHYYLTKINGKMYNATASAIKAGYSKNTARMQGSRLLTKDNIQKRIDELQKERLKRTDLSADYLIIHLMKIVEDDITNYIDVKETQLGTSVKIKDLDNIDTWNIQEIGINNNGGLKLKTHDKMKAISALADILKDSKGTDEDSLSKQLENIKTIAEMLNNPRPNRDLNDYLGDDEEGDEDE